jgi:acetyl esterase/lipase
VGKAIENALYHMGAKIAGTLAANPGMSLDSLRLLLEDLQSLSSEPTDVTYEEVQAGDVPAIWARPVGASRDHVILYTHGGGFVTNSASSHRKLAGHLARRAGMNALVIDYRRAPEHPFPAQLEDAVKAHEWLRAQGFKPEKTAVAGDSAGGNLAITTALKLRELGKPLPGAVIAFSPWLDMGAKGDTFESNAKTDVFINRDMAVMMAGLYLGGASATNPLANPLHADLKGLPPLYVIAGDAEVLQADAQRFVDRARAAGADASVVYGAGQQHVYQFMAGRSPEADASIADAAKWLRKKFGIG